MPLSFGTAPPLPLPAVTVDEPDSADGDPADPVTVVVTVIVGRLRSVDEAEEEEALAVDEHGAPETIAPI